MPGNLKKSDSEILDHLNDRDGFSTDQPSRTHPNLKKSLRILGISENYQGLDGEYLDRSIYSRTHGIGFRSGNYENQGFSKITRDFP